MKLIEQTDRYAIWASQETYGVEYWIYGVTASGSPMTAPSLDMARSIAAAHS